jgi:hypothetical protein
VLLILTADVLLQFDRRVAQNLETVPLIRRADVPACLGRGLFNATDTLFLVVLA